MDFIKFSLLFILAHGVSYIFAGLIALRISKDIYESRKRLCTFLRNMSDKDESLHVSFYFIPGQIIRGLLMAIVLLPLLNTIGEFSFLLKATFFGGLMFVYTHFAAASPFIDNIEGFIYFKKEYLMKKAFLKFQLEMLIYCIIFGTLMAFFMGLI